MQRGRYIAQHDVGHHMSKEQLHILNCVLRLLEPYDSLSNSRRSERSGMYSCLPLLRLRQTGKANQQRRRAL